MVEEALKDLGPELHDTGYVILLSICIGTIDADVLARVSGHSRDFVRLRFKRLRDQGVIVRRTFHVQWFDEDPKIANLAFVLDAMVAEGLVRRTLGAGSPSYYPVD